MKVPYIRNTDSSVSYFIGNHKEIFYLLHISSLVSDGSFCLNKLITDTRTPDAQ